MQAPLSFADGMDDPCAAAEAVERRSGLSDVLMDPQTSDTVGLDSVEQIVSAPPRSLWARLPIRARQPAQPAAGKIARWRETHARSLAKAVSWRATGSLDTFVVAFLVTGSPKIAGSVALTEVMTKIVIYYCHERLWALVPWGKRSRQAVAEQSG
jgi:uncharacterized membrane protein